jgi:hypothetical protein
MEDGRNSTPLVIKRADLYQQVWSTPLVQLAARYKTTMAELANMCTRLNVPRPPSGYWLKKSTGKPVAQAALPPADTETVLEATLTKPSPEQTEFENRLSIARAKYCGLDVPQEIGHPHWLIERWLAEHERKRKELTHFRPPAFTELDHRRFRFLDALFKAMEAIGFEINLGELNRAYLSFDGERVDFTLRERQKLVRLPLDDKRYKGWNKELRPTGDLVFKITTWLPQEMPTVWRDDAQKPLEWQLDDIVAVLSLVAPHLVRQRNLKTAEQKRRWEEEHRQRLARERREQDNKRWLKMLDFARQRDLAESLRRLLADIAFSPQPEGSFDGLTSDEWLAWAHQWLDRFDPIARGPKALYEELAAVRA